MSENALERSADGQSCIVMSAMNANKIRLQLLRCLDDDKPPGHPFRGPDNGRVMEKVQEVLNMHLVQDGHHVATSDGKRTASFLLDTYSGGNEAQWNAEKFGLTNTHTGRASCLIRTDEVASAGIVILCSHDIDVSSFAPRYVFGRRKNPRSHQQYAVCRYARGGRLCRVYVYQPHTTL